MIHFDRKNPPPLGGFPVFFPIYYVPSSRTVCKRTPLEGFVQVLRGGSSYEGMVTNQNVVLIV